MTREQVKLHHERPTYELLGRMVFVAAHLELRLQMLATTLVASPYSAHWINGESSSRVIKLIGNVAKEHPRISEEELESLQTVLKECTDLLTRRHAHVHGAWVMDQPDLAGPVFLQTMRFTRGKQTPTFAPLSAEDLVDLIAGFHQVITKVDFCFLALAADPGPQVAD